MEGIYLLYHRINGNENKVRHAHMRIPCAVLPAQHVRAERAREAAVLTAVHGAGASSSGWENAFYLRGR